jgi:restriction endonuclease S subunit
MQLSDISDIFTGINYAKREQSPPHRGIPLIQVKDYISSVLNKDNIFWINKESVEPKSVLTPNDVLFAAKGLRNFAVHYRNELGPAAAASTFYIIRIKEHNLLPEYLCWYMNQNEIQDYFKSHVRGVITPSLTIPQVGDLPIRIPALDIQKQILHIQTLLRQEKELAEEIWRKRNQIISKTLNQSITKNA